MQPTEEKEVVEGAEDNFIQQCQSLFSLVLIRACVSEAKACGPETAKRGGTETDWILRTDGGCGGAAGGGEVQVGWEGC